MRALVALAGSGSWGGTTARHAVQPPRPIPGKIRPGL